MGGSTQSVPNLRNVHPQHISTGVPPHVEEGQSPADTMAQHVTRPVHGDHRRYRDRIQLLRHARRPTTYIEPNPTHSQILLLNFGFVKNRFHSSPEPFLSQTSRYFSTYRCPTSEALVQPFFSFVWCDTQTRTNFQFLKYHRWRLSPPRTCWTEVCVRRPKGSDVVEC